MLKELYKNLFRNWVNLLGKCYNAKITIKIYLEIELIY